MKNRPARQKTGFWWGVYNIMAGSVPWEPDHELWKRENDVESRVEPPFNKLEWAIWDDLVGRSLSLVRFTMTGENIEEIDATYFLKPIEEKVQWAATKSI